MRFILMLFTVGILLSMLCCEKTTEPASPAGEIVYVEGGNVYYFQYLATSLPFTSTSAKSPNTITRP